MELLQYTASLPEVSGHCNACNTLLHCLEAVGSGNPVTHCLIAGGGREIAVWGGRIQLRKIAEKWRKNCGKLRKIAENCGKIAMS